jgi:hypothetical protein
MARQANKNRKAALGWYGRPYDPDEIGEQQIITALSRTVNAARRLR